MNNNGKNVKGLVVLVIVLIIIVLGLAGYLVYDKVLNNKDKTTNIDNKNNQNNTEVVKKDLKVEIKDDNMFYVNGNKVDFYASTEYKEYINTESDFYIGLDQKTTYTYEQVGDVLFVEVAPQSIAYGIENYFVDENGKILKKVNGVNADIILSFNTYVKFVKVEGNSIYLSTRDKDILFAEQPVCVRIAENKQNDIAEYTDKITYQNGEFKLEKGVSTKTFEQYRAERKIYCPEIINDYNKSKAVDGTNEQIAVIKDNKLLLLNNQNELLSELATLDSSNYIINRASIITTEDKLCVVSQNGTYIFVSNGLSGNDEKMYAIYYNEKYGTKSELVMQNINGEFPGLISCK